MPGADADAVHCCQRRRIDRAVRSRVIFSRSAGAQTAAMSGYCGNILNAKVFSSPDTLPLGE